MKQLALVIILLSMMNCKPKANEKPITNTIESIHRKWMLLSFKNFSKEELIRKVAFLDFTNKEYVTASMGCNNLSATYSIKSTAKIDYLQWIRTEMACEDMKLEDEFSKVIQDFTTYKIVGHNLTLYNFKNEKLIFVAQDWD